MKQYQRKIEEYKSLIQKEYIRETAVHTVKERCSDIMNRQDNRRASYFEFLFEQFKFIKKRWWVLQGGILILLWILLVDSDLCCKDIAVFSGGFTYDYLFFRCFSLYITDFGIPTHHRFLSAV